MHDNFSITGNSCRIPFADLCRRDTRYQAYFTRKTYAGAQCIHPQGTKINHFGIVVDGILKAVDVTMDGAEMCHAYFEPKDIFPEFLYFSGKREYTYSCLLYTSVLLYTAMGGLAWYPKDTLPLPARP